MIINARTINEAVHGAGTMNGAIHEARPMTLRTHGIVEEVKANPRVLIVEDNERMINNYRMGYFATGWEAHHFEYHPDRHQELLPFVMGTSSPQGTPLRPQLVQVDGLNGRWRNVIEALRPKLEENTRYVVISTNDALSKAVRESGADFIDKNEPNQFFEYIIRLKESVTG
jgi:hypothetical protein